jgi:hypothetical protein
MLVKPASVVVCIDSDLIAGSDLGRAFEQAATLRALLLLPIGYLT